MKKWDGHTHSEFCKHGSGEKTSYLVERAIELGFNKYSITEHAPLPIDLFGNSEIAQEFTLLQDELENYLEHLVELKKQYERQIEILIGLEIDFVSGYEDYTSQLLKKYKTKLDDLIVSLHFIPGKHGITPVDYSIEAFQTELLDHYGSVDKVHDAYWETMEKLILTELDFGKTKRIGHFGLINKYKLHFPLSAPDHFSQAYFKNMFYLIKKHNWHLDYNVAGLRKKHCQDVYLTEPMLFWCKKLGIEMIYGSDAHDVKSIGANYDLYLNAMTMLS
ncbi:histidinol-phosphatase HisJ [bacterium]|nr:histidinol-phosphatase HisJ [bacterium]